MLICLWFTFAVLQVSCKNKSTTKHTTQFMVRTEEGSVLYLYTIFEADSSIRSKVIKGVPKFGSWVTWPHPVRGRFLVSVPREGPSSMSVPNLKWIALFVQKLLGVPKFRNWVTWLTKGASKATPLLNLKHWISVEIRLTILAAKFYASSFIHGWVIDESNVNGPF